MREICKLLATASLTICFLSSTAYGASIPATKADTVLINGAIYTMDACRRWADAAAIKDGKFIFVGTDKEAQKFSTPDTEVIDLHGQMVLPGFHDCHVHPIESGIELGQCRLDKAETKKEILETIKLFAAQHPNDQWILGGGWTLPAFPGANPLASDLDLIAPNRPVYLTSQDGHSAWVNSKALQMANITSITKDPELGRIERSDDGNPSGTLREEGAASLVANLVPPPSMDERIEGAKRALKLANSFGITSVQDAHVTEDFLTAYKELEKQGGLTIRLTAALHTDPLGGPQQVAKLMLLRDQFTSDLIKPTSAKIFADGVIESHTAALLEPYTDRPSTKGLPNFSDRDLEKLIVELDRAQFQVHVHAIGDAAVHSTLDAFASARQKNGIRDSRHQIAHLELIAPGDIERFRQMGVIANFEAMWAYPDKYITEYTEPFIGPERSKRLYQIHSVMKTGAVVSAGSDWSVTSLNPLDAIQVAVTRRALDDTKSLSWLMDERVDLADILSAYTINGAYANHQETLTGSIEAGKAADFIVLSHNLFAIPPEQIHNTKVLQTYLNGKCIYKMGGGTISERLP